MAIAKYIKEIGRGAAGARSLSQDAAADLMQQVLAGTVSDLEIGAFALAMRIKGETVDELLGFARATHASCLRLPSDRPVVVIPSYNGARRLPNLTPLLAMRLAQEGARVLVHGPRHDPTRVTSAEIFEALGLPPVDCAAAVQERWARQQPAFITTDALSPALQRLLDVRWVVGLRNSGHTVAKLLAPLSVCQPAFQVVNYTHPEYATLQAEFLVHTQANAVLLRGTEGEPVADPRRAPKLEVFINGQLRADLSRSAHEGVLTELPLLPRTCDAPTTARYIQAVVSGEKPAPTPLTQQVDCLVRALAAVTPTTAQEHTA